MSIYGESEKKNKKSFPFKVKTKKKYMNTFLVKVKTKKQIMIRIVIIYVIGSGELIFNLEELLSISISISLK
jgi:hypothetical protein